VEVEFSVGPIPIDDALGKEIVTRYTTGIDSGDLFYTDSNGREMQRRQVCCTVHVVVYCCRRDALVVRPFVCWLLLLSVLWNVLTQCAGELSPNVEPHCA
jgi:hypothetical protein